MGYISDQRFMLNQHLFFMDEDSDLNDYDEIDDGIDSDNFDTELETIADVVTMDNMLLKVIRFDILGAKTYQAL
ncbi:Protein ycf2 [Acorus gramineus]|uniref:Protein ycf2 n=1 Tax=Acorus gramineus TaxID=55184 RepID=A0AAV9AQS5_ACOGR|nr:Protein ycf2 [Acorus gramineus]